jgi:hypothetical protein
MGYLDKSDDGGAGIKKYINDSVEKAHPLNGFDLLDVKDSKNLIKRFKIQLNQKILCVQCKNNNCNSNEELFGVKFEKDSENSRCFWTVTDTLQYTAKDRFIKIDRGLKRTLLMNYNRNRLLKD